MIGLIFKGIFMIGIMSWYSAGVWKVINEYFRKEFDTYLKDETKKNKFMDLGKEEDKPATNEVLMSAIQNLKEEIRADHDDIKFENGKQSDKINVIGNRPLNNNEELISKKEDSTNDEQQHEIDLDAKKRDAGETNLNDDKIDSFADSHDNLPDEISMIKYWSARNQEHNHYNEEQFCNEQHESREISECQEL